MAEVPRQKCPNCGAMHDVRVYVTGQRLRCRCGLHFVVQRNDVPRPQPATPRPPAKAAEPARPTPAPEPPPPAPEQGQPASAVNPPALAAALEAAEALEATPVRPESAPPVAEQALAKEPPPAEEMAPTVVAKGLQVPGYEMLELLGRGGMGEVWKACQKETGRLVAIKTLSTALAKQQDFVRRFEKEAAALAALSHPGIVGIVESGFSDACQTWYLAMDLCEGDSLRARMEKGDLGWREGVQLIARVCRAMDHAHEHGVIHRDLKPENILVGQGGEPKVVDFGLAGMPADERMNLTGAAMAMGTLHYMAPEQRTDARSVDARADVFALGVILYELLVGEVPVGRFKLPSQLNEEIDPRIDHVVARALEPEPSARLKSAGEMAFELEGILSSEPEALRGPKNATRLLPAEELESSSASRESLRPLIGALAIVFGIVVVLLLTHPWSRSPRSSLPRDTMGTLGVRLDRQGGDLRLGFQPGRELLHAYNGEWSLQDGSLVARVFGDGSKPLARPFAILDTAPIGAERLLLEAELTLDPTPPAGHRSKEPARAELALQGESGALLALEARLEPGRLALVHRSRDGADKVLGTAEAPLKAGEPLLLRLAVVDGRLEASAGQREPLGVVLREPLPQGAFAGKPALVCSEATCRFRSWRIASSGEARGRAGR